MALCITLDTSLYPSEVLIALKRVVIAEAHLEQSSSALTKVRVNTSIPIESFMMNEARGPEASLPQVYYFFRGH